MGDVVGKLLNSAGLRKSGYQGLEKIDAFGDQDSRISREGLWTDFTSFVGLA